MAIKNNQSSSQNKKAGQSAAKSTTQRVQATTTIAAPGFAEEDHIVWKRALMASFIVVFVLMTIMSFSYGISGDEVYMNEYGKAILKYFSTFGHDQSVFHLPKDIDRDSNLIYYGGLFDLICALVNKISPFAEYTTRHILNAWAGFLAIFFAAKVCIRLFNRQVGVFCVWLMFLSPFFLGHAMDNPKDIPFATAYIAAIYFIIRLFDKLPKPSVKDYLWAILSIGATIGVRVGGILLIPYQFVFIGLIFFIKKWFQGEKVNIGMYAKPVIIISVLGFAVGCIFWPYALQNPISNPFNALSQMSNFKVSIGQLYEGKKIPSDELPANYLIKNFIITNTYALLLGIVLMTIFLWKLRKYEMAPALYFILFTGIFPVAYIIYEKSNVYHAWRHVLFIFPSMAIYASGGWYMFSQYMSKRKLKAVGLGLLGVLLIEPIVFIISTYPNTVTYYNAFVGGIEGAYGNYEMDYYYNSLKQAADWFKNNVADTLKPTDTIILATNAQHLLLRYFPKNKNIKIEYVRYPERDEKQWDYAIFHIALIPDDEIRSGTWLPKTTMYKASVKGFPLCAVIKRPSYLDLKGFDALQRNQVDSGMNDFKAYLNYDPTNVEMLNIMANIYHQLGHDDSASYYLNKARMLDPVNTDD